MTLSDKINEFEIIDSVCEDSLSVQNVKETNKKILERIDKAVYKWMKDLGIFESAESVNIPDVLDLEKEIIDIIKSEMGERIVKE